MGSKGLRLIFVLTMLMLSTMTMISEKAFGDPPIGPECPTSEASPGSPGACLCRIHCGNGSWFNGYVTPSGCSGIFLACCGGIGDMSCVP